MLAFMAYPFVMAYILVFRFVKPVKIRGYAKVIIGLILGLGSLKTYIYLLTGGTMMDPEMGRTATIITSALFFSCVILMLLTILRDLINLSYKLISRSLKASLINSSSIRIAVPALLLSFFIGTSGVLNAFDDPLPQKYSFSYANLPQAADGFKIAGLADIHASRPVRESDIQNIVTMTNCLEPDLILILGDFVDGGIPDLDHLTSELFNLRAKYGIYAISGNHEFYSGYSEWLDYFTQGGFTFLENKSTLIKLEDGTAAFNLAGVTDISAMRFGLKGADPDLALKDTDPTLPVIFMSHQPITAIGLEDKVDLFLAGHTHGGLAPLLRSIVAFVNQGLVSGHYDLGREQVIVSNGTRLWMGMPFRLDNPAQIIEITLRTKAE